MTLLSSSSGEVVAVVGTSRSCLGNWCQRCGKQLLLLLEGEGEEGVQSQVFLSCERNTKPLLPSVSPPPFCGASHFAPLSSLGTLQILQKKESTTTSFSRFDSKPPLIATPGCALLLLRISPGAYTVSPDCSDSIRRRRREDE